MKKEKLQFAVDKSGKKTFLGSGGAFYKAKDKETIVVDGTTEDVKKIMKGKKFDLDEKNKTIKVL